MSMTEILQLFDLPHELIPRHLQPVLYSLTDLLPPVPLGGFECTLQGVARVDFQQGFRPRAWDQHLLGSLEPCTQLVQAWKTSRGIDEIWLEFDDLSFTQMGVFFGLDMDSQDAEAHRFAIRQVLTALGTGGWHLLERYQKVCRDRQQISHFGLMPHRGPSVRLNVKRVDPGSIRDFLLRAGWPGPAEVVTEFTSLAEGVDHFALCLDVEKDGDLRDSLAIECFFRRQPPEEAGWMRLLSRLGGIEQRRAAALLGWPTILTPVSGREWPSALIQRSLLDSGPARLGLKLSHLKVQWRAGSFQSKAYFGFEYAG